MRWLDLTLDSPEENLALDEALLEQAESAGRPREAARVWESPLVVAVVGRSSCVHDEVRVDFCQSHKIPVLRRCSGGASVLIGPGCLMYAVVLSYELRPALRMVEEAHRFVLDRLARALEPMAPGAVERAGISDLAWNRRKFSGNSLRCERTHLLYHGTLLYDFPLELIGACLRSPPRQPDYRAGRSHGDFLTNLPAAADGLRQCLNHEWQPDEAMDDWPHDATARLTSERYTRHDWNHRR